MMIINMLIACYLIIAHISLFAQPVSLNKQSHLIAINVVFVMMGGKKENTRKREIWIISHAMADT